MSLHPDSYWVTDLLLKLYMGVSGNQFTMGMVDIRSSSNAASSLAPTLVHSINNLTTQIELSLVKITAFRMRLAGWTKQKQG